MKETLEQINKLIENYIHLERLCETAGMRGLRDVSENIKAVADCTRSAIIFATKSLMIIKGGGV